MLQSIARPAVVTAPPAIKLDLAGRIDDDIACRKCGYNLRTLLPEANCPECGAAAALSLRSNLLRDCDPTWVTDLKSGASWMIGAYVIVIILFLTTITLAAGWNQRLWGLSGFFLGSSLIMLLGVWQITAPDPSGHGEHDGISVRKLVRMAFIIGPTMAAIGWLIRDYYVFSYWLLPSTFVDIACELTLFSYVRRLAFRLPNQKLARRCRLFMWGRTSAHLVSLISWVFWMLSTAPGMLTARVLANLFELVLFLVFSIWAVFLFRRFRAEFDFAAHVARKSWANQPGTTTSTLNGPA